MVVHKPVLLDEIISELHIKKQARYIDATLGAAGHSVEIIKKGGFIYGIEYDPEMVKVAKKNLEEACPTAKDNFRSCFKIINSNFADIAILRKQYKIDDIEGVLFDLGISTLHYKKSERGFSFAHPQQRLDMRLNPQRQNVKAGDLINILTEQDLYKLFKPFVGFKLTKILVKNIIKARPIYTVGELLELVPNPRGYKKHPATKVFLALRIAVNSELDNLQSCLVDYLDLLNPGGRIFIITFHSTEQKLVRNLLTNWQKMGFGKLVGEPILPGKSELKQNPSARSAMLNIFKKAKYEKKN